MDRLRDKVAIITGGARGQGAAEARLFAAEGAHVVATDILDDEGKAVAEEVGDAVTYLHHDVRREEDWAQVVAETEARFGRIDVLVNNAGILVTGKMTHELPLAEYMEVVETNQVGVFLGMRAVVPVMLRRRAGSIINISSYNGLAGLGGMVAYTASKFAVRGMTKVAALEYGKAGIRVNSVHPGGVDTDMTRALWGGRPMTPAEEQLAYGRTAIGRVGQPAEIGAAVLFLASDESSFCTGAEFVVDGGMSAGQVIDRARA
ncbi:MAG TPA: glucose 1-dehydrogenase [Acidimicrobiales bacterium]|nr:glucose 1-dehydrogenase [Acidimicrobiales bacterium]